MVVTRANERKVVTALFCDLVGFTSMSEAADPEDVDRILDGYFAMARRQIEAHGGIVEKFIGDAVVGLFGAPTTHEDDAERAVRAGLRIAEEAARLPGAAGNPLQLRVGINTGEALVKLGVDAGSGEGLVVGDAINTAARIQSAAPVNGVAVGLATWETTHLAIEYEEAEPATLKGKSEPVRIFHARTARSSLGVDLSRSHAGAYVGREAELARLQAAFDSAAHGAGMQFVAVVGEAGLGKSRIVDELARRITAAAPDVRWRRGRSLPYGDGIAFWALGEILKGEAGIIEGDDLEAATAKVAGRLAVDFDDVDRAWLLDRLLPLVGAGTSSADRGELFAAWRTFLERLALRAPLVVVLEDVHWADDGLVAFMRSLVEARSTARVLVLATTRPLADHGGNPLEAFDEIRLEPLSAAQAEELIEGILGTALPGELARTVVDRAEGNPLFAEEFVRLLIDRDLLTVVDGSLTLRPGATVPLPSSISALLGARLDALEPSRKGLLADASVIGTVFWLGALASISERPQREVQPELEDLARVALIRPIAEGSMDGELEYSFWHVLARDVAYAQLPRGVRAQRHAAAAAWLEAKAANRLDDVAELLAHHYATALDLAVVAGDNLEEDVLRERAVTYLARAGRRTLGLNPGAAITHLRRALALAQPDDPQRPDMLVALGEALDLTSERAGAERAFTEAIAGYEAHGERSRVARTILRRRLVHYALGELHPGGPADRAIAMLADLPPSEDLVYCLTEQAVEELAAGRAAEALATIDRSIGVAASLGLEPPPRLLRFRAAARISAGDRGGLADFDRAIAAAEAAGNAHEAALASLWRESNRYLHDGVAKLLPDLEAIVGTTERRGLVATHRLAAANLTWAYLDNGAHDRALEIARDIRPAVMASGERGLLAMLLVTRITVATMRGELDEVPAMLAELDAIDTELYPEWTVCMVVTADARAALGDRVGAVADLEALARSDRDVHVLNYGQSLGVAVRLALELGATELAEALLADWTPMYEVDAVALRFAEACIAESGGDLELAALAFEDAAVRYGAFGLRPAAAIALLGLARVTTSVGKPGAAAIALERARAIFESLRAAPWLARCDAVAARLHATREKPS